MPRTTEVRLRFSNFDFFDLEGFAIGFEKEKGDTENMSQQGELSTLKYTADVLRQKADEIEEEING